MNNANNKLKRKISELKSINWNSLCASVTASSINPIKMWNNIGNIDGSKSKKIVHLPGMNLSEKQKTEVFAKHFSKIFSNSNNSSFKHSTSALLNEASDCSPKLSSLLLHLGEPKWKV